MEHVLIVAQCNKTGDTIIHLSDVINNPTSDKRPNSLLVILTGEAGCSLRARFVYDKLVG